jgi:hypothetical protein
MGRGEFTGRRCYFYCSSRLSNVDETDACQNFFCSCNDIQRVSSFVRSFVPMS